MEKVMSKIEKLLSLSESSNQNEATNAMLKAQELMAKHNLSQDEIATKKEGDFEMNFAFNEFGRHRRWKQTLVSIIAENFRCITVKKKRWDGSSNFHVIGEPDDVEIAIAVFSFAEDFAQKNALEYAKKRIEEDPTMKKHRVKNDYIFGFIKGVRDKLEAQKEQINSESNALVVREEELDKFAEEELGKLGTESRRTTLNVQGDRQAQDKGYNDGSNLPFEERLNHGT